jgi:hypothetical protein
MATTVKKEKTQSEQLLDLVKYMVNEDWEFTLSNGDVESLGVNGPILEMPICNGKLILDLGGWKYIED